MPRGKIRRWERRIRKLTAGFKSTGTVWHDSTSSRAAACNTVPPQPPAHDQERSPLFTIPPELRVLILRWVLTKGSPISPQRKSHREEERATILSLFRTCMRIRQEATKLYFNANTFRFFDDGELDEIELPLFFQSLPPERLRLCARVSLEASLGPQHRGHHGQCVRKYCVGSVEIDLRSMTATTLGRTNCCDRCAEELETARERVQAVLGVSGGGAGIQGLDEDREERAAFGRRVGRAFCETFEHLHPDYGGSEAERGC